MKYSTKIQIIIILLCIMLDLFKSDLRGSEGRYTYSYDLNTVEIGKKYEHTFKIINPSKRPLKIEHISKTCGCIEATLVKKEIGINDYIELKTAIDISEKVKPGETRQSIVLIDSSSPPAIIEFELSGRLPLNDILEHYPEIVRMGEIPRKKIYKGYFAISRIDKSELLYERFEVSNQAIKINPINPFPSITDKMFFEIEIETSKCPIGEFNETIKIITRNTKHPFDVIKVIGKVLCDVYFAPNMIFLRPSDQCKKWEINICSYSGDSINVLDLNFTLGEDWHVNLIENRILTVTYQGNERKFVKGQIELKIRRGQSEMYDTLIIPVIGIVG